MKETLVWNWRIKIVTKFVWDYKTSFRVNMFHVIMSLWYRKLSLVLCYLCYHSALLSWNIFCICKNGIFLLLALTVISTETRDALCFAVLHTERKKHFSAFETLLLTVLQCIKHVANTARSSADIACRNVPPSPSSVDALLYFFAAMWLQFVVITADDRPSTHTGNKQEFTVFCGASLAGYCTLILHCLSEARIPVAMFVTK